MDLHLLFCALFFLVGITAEEITCPPNEEFKECESVCPPTCQNTSPQICTDLCIIGCSCKKGFIRESPGGRCIESCEGVPVCKDNERFTTCATACPRICNQTEIQACPLLCKTGCVCADGFIREREGESCIPEGRCQPKCGINEAYTECGSPCPGTCSQPSKVCERKCVEGCFCKQGYLLDENSGACVRRNDCPN
ncbi:serine protease inhibitor swm-1-like [Zophobas morio]|uniref:serine protease inhibitor swm-1-like n=1 Tax=Zophobas morio TaxID=2755281 RepID=UPI0030826FD4